MFFIKTSKNFWICALTMITLLGGFIDAQAAQSDGVRKSIKINGLNVSYLQWGPDNAPPMLLISGAGSVASVWANVAPAFAGEYRVVSFETPGQGYSDWDPAKKYDVMSHAAYLKEAVRMLGLKNIVVIGHSQGGNEAVVYAAEDADNVIALVAEDGGYMMPGSTRAARRAEDAKNGVAPRPAPKTEFSSWEEVLSTPSMMTGNLTPQQRRAEAENRYKQQPDGKIISRNDPAVAPMSEADDMMQAGATAPYAQRIKSPSMVIRGLTDKSFEKENGEMLISLLPNVRMWVQIPGAGHNLHKEKPAEFITAVRGFLTMVKPAKSGS